ncbi:MAG TPA: hypothetical protein VJT72_11070 [Pseudonocardiaceae bacterium]|nr:hypothetical protein [Pseudonocardiaceae bacterium]
MLLTVVLLLAAVGLLVAALGTDQLALAWGSVALSALVAAMILARWRRRRDAAEVEPTGLLDDESADAHGDQVVDPGRDASPVEHSTPGSVTTAEHADPMAASAGTDQKAGLSDAEPGEEDTDAADLLVVYELTDEVLVVDEHPRYHLTRCPWPEQSRVERLPVREARELGFTPCARCRPDTTLARRHRATSTAAN